MPETPLHVLEETEYAILAEMRRVGAQLEWLDRAPERVARERGRLHGRIMDLVDQYHAMTADSGGDPLPVETISDATMIAPAVVAELLAADRPTDDRSVPPAEMTDAALARAYLGAGLPSEEDHPIGIEFGERFPRLMGLRAAADHLRTVDYAEGDTRYRDAAIEIGHRFRRSVEMIANPEWYWPPVIDE